MGFEAVDQVRDRMTEMKCIDTKTTLVLNHFAHFDNFTHEKICRIENQRDMKLHTMDVHLFFKEGVN